MRASGAAFNQIGTTPTTTTTTPKNAKPTTTTTSTTVPHAQVSVDVLNASNVGGIAHTTAASLTAQGFVVNEVGDTSTQLNTAGTSEILYGPAGTAAAQSLLGSLTGGPVTLVPDPSLTGSTVELVLAGTAAAATAGTAPNGTTTTTAPLSTTTTTIPGDVYTNLQPEPWNPSPCTLGQPTTTTTTAHKASKKG